MLTLKTKKLNRNLQKTITRTKKPKLIPDVAIHPDAESIEFFPDEFAHLKQLVSETQPVAVSFEEGEEGVVENHVDIAPDAIDSPFAETEDVPGVGVDDIDHDTVEDVPGVGVAIDVSDNDEPEGVLDADDDHEDDGPLEPDLPHAGSSEISDAEDSPDVDVSTDDTEEEVMDVLQDSPNTNSDVVSDPKGVPDAADDDKDVPCDSPCADSEQSWEAKGSPDGDDFSDADDRFETDSLDGSTVSDDIKEISSEQSRERLLMTFKIPKYTDPADYSQSPGASEIGSAFESVGDLAEKSDSERRSVRPKKPPRTFTYDVLGKPSVKHLRAKVCSLLDPAEEVFVPKLVADGVGVLVTKKWEIC